MKVEIPNLYDPINGTPSEINLVSNPHNIRFSHARQNCIYFQIIRFPYSKMIADVTSDNITAGEIKPNKSYIRICIRRQNTDMQFVFRYTVEAPEKKHGNELRRRSIIEKERVFIIRADKDEIVRMGDPFITEIENMNDKRSARIYLNSYNEWAHPVTLQSVISKLTEDQKAIAAKMINEYFTA